MEDPRFIDITVNIQNPCGDIWSLVKKLKPHWDSKRLKLKFYTEGKLNTCVRCHPTDESEDAIMIRIYNTEMTSYIDRKAEIRANQFVHHCGYGSKVLATFHNGFCYQFLPGKSLAAEFLTQEDIWKSIAQGLAVIHSIQSDLPKKSKLFDVLHNYVRIIPEELPDRLKNKMYKSIFPTKKHLISELKHLEAHLMQTETPLVFCHGDPRPENIIWNGHSKKIMFVDFEFASYNYQAYDIAAHFYSYAGLSDDPDFSLYPDETFQTAWLREYLQRYYEYNGKSAIATPQDVRTLYIQVQKFSLATHMMMAISGFLNAALPAAEFDFFKFGIKRIQEYYKYKTQILHLALP